MAVHVRQQIRDAIVEKLTGLTTTSDRIIVGRTRPLPRDYEPTLLVYTTPAESGGQESARVLTLSYPRRLERAMSLSIMGRVQQAEPPDDLLDQIALEVEVALALPLSDEDDLTVLIKDMALVSTVSQVDANGDRHEGAIRLVYSIIYHTIENAPGTAA